MPKRISTISWVSVAVGFSILLAFPAGAQTVFIDASRLVPKVEVYFSPRTGSFVEGSTFDIPILINTRGASVNGLEIKVTFDRDKLEIVKPSTGQSIIGVWVEPPSYDNARGTANYTGVIPNGIITSAGHVGTITFRAKKTGRAVLSITSASKVLLNDGQGSEAQIDLGRSEYTILGKAPEGVRVYSETHPFQSEWYNNDSPVIFWDKDEGVTGFSYVVDDKPTTIPENEVLTAATTQAFEGLEDGLWYFHIKAYKNGVWGTTGHFLMRIDTAPPADFTPEIDFLLGAVAMSQRALVSFFTTDNLSGLDHYEVGILDRSQPVTVSPAFVQAESPFQIPLSSDKLSVIVRAVDKAGNIRDVSLAVAAPSFVQKFLKDNLVYLLLFIILAGIIGLIFHYLVGHHIIRYLRKAAELIEQEEAEAPHQATILPPERLPPPVSKYSSNPYEITPYHPESRQE
jgi:hypothetical protein